MRVEEIKELARQGFAYSRYITKTLHPHDAPVEITRAAALLVQLSEQVCKLLGHEPDKDTQ